MSDRILIVRIGALGDALHTLPLLNELRRRAPDAEIDWAAGKSIIRFLEGHKAVRKFVPVERGARGLLKAALAVRDQYDLAIDTQGLIKSALLARAAAPKVIGRAFGHAREFPATWFYTEKIAPPSAHIIDQNLDLLAASYPSETREVRYDIPVPLLPDWPLLIQNPIIFNIGGGWWTKLWPLENFAALAREIDAVLGISVGIVWGPGEEKAAQTIANLSPARVAPATTFAELAAIFQRCRLLVSGETGPLHLAAAVGCPTVALLGPTHAARNGPYGAGHVVLEPELLCRPCFSRTCSDFRCMPAISVARVFDAIATGDILQHSNIQNK